VASFAAQSSNFPSHVFWALSSRLPLVTTPLPVLPHITDQRLPFAHRLLDGGSGGIKSSALLPEPSADIRR